MKKTLIVSAFALSLMGIAYAADSTTTPPALPPMITTGSSTVDAQVKALRQSYEVKIKALQQEYLTQLKALIGARMASTTPKMDNGKHLGEEKRGMMGTTTASGTPMMPRKGGDENGQGGRGQGGDRGQMMGPQVEGTSTENQGVGAFMQLFRGFFGR